MSFVIYVIFVLVCARISFVTSTNSSQPRIYTSNGHLVFQAADGKDVALITSSEGRLFLNGQEMTHVAKQLGKVMETIEDFRSRIEQFDGKLARFSNNVGSTVEGIQMNEGSAVGAGANVSVSANGGGSSSSAYLLIRVTRLNRRVSLIDMRVKRLIRILRNNDCNSNPCANGGTCQDIYNGYICTCPENWEGPSCSVDVNECARFASTDLGCQNGATCVNRVGSYECLCATGWMGMHCTKKRGTDCNSASSFELCGHGICVSQNTPAGYSCICHQGWTTEGTSPACSKDVDECAANHPPCSANPQVPCINLPGTYHCGNCPNGYTGNGYHCADIDECATGNGGCSMSPMVQCLNTPGSRVCSTCPPGYQGDGVTCSYVGAMCSTRNGGCHPLATCRDNARK